MRRLVFSILLVAALAATPAEPVVRPASNTDPGGKVGERPYEMVWAERKPEHPEVVDFEDLTGWMAAGFLGCTAELFRSREEQMFGTYTGKAVYAGKTAASYFELRPPKPIPIPGEPTAAQLWVRGNNWGWYPKPQTARTNVYAIVRDAKGEHFCITLGHVNFDYWFLLHAAFVSPTGQLAGRIRKEGDGDGKIDYPLSFLALRVTNCANEKPAKLSFDSLQFYKADYQRPLPEAKLLPGGPWPTTPDTITPTPSEKVTNAIRRQGETLILEARSRRETIRWLYTPKTGSLSDLTVEVNGRRFQPCADGGPVFLVDGRERTLGQEGIYTLLQQADWSLDPEGEEFQWSAESNGFRLEYSYRFRAKGKSLQIEVLERRAPYVQVTGPVTAFRIGHTAGTPKAELIGVPYLTFGNVGPHIVHWDGIFLSGLLDWYNSDASTFFEEHGQPKPDQLVYNGGSRYLPKTNGERNQLRERLILTVSTDFAEVLPNIPHPKNPTAPLATGAIWRNVGEPVPDLLKRLKAHGVEGFICPLHEVGWRDAGESFTFRLRCAPRIGDEKMKEYGKWVNGLGYRFGLYANYTDYSPVNENWREDRVCLDSDGNWRGAWPRCYAPKPTYAWQAEAELAPKIAEKFGAVTCYSDVHTAIRPWDRTDYDARSHGAGMFRAAWESYAHILWNECRAYNGPVFSEGGMHWMYAGLISGNYGQMTGPERWRQPPLVDFDLLKMHPLMCDFGMGSPDMFYSGNEWHRDKSRTSPWLDRFITSTLAFGHIGFLPLEWGFDGALKSFYMTNAVQRLYALQPVEEICYFDGEKLLPTSDAIRTGAYRLGQVYVRYASGLRLWCNLSFDHDWRVTCDGKTYLLPATGHLAFLKGLLLQYSALVDGKRIDYVQSPEYLYLDTRDTFAVAGPLACRGAVAFKFGPALPFRVIGPSIDLSNPPLPEPEPDWLIPATTCTDLTVRPLGRARDMAVTAEAFDLEDKPLGDAEVRVSNLGHTILPVKGAVRYRLKVPGRTAAPAPDEKPRYLVAGLDYPVKASVVNFGEDTLCDAVITAELLPPLSPREREGVRGASEGARPGTIPPPVVPHPSPLPEGEGGGSPLPDIRRGREGQTQLTIHVPADATPGERLWYRVRVVGRIGRHEAEGISWFTGIAAKPIEVVLQPATLAPAPPGARQELGLALRSNLPGRTRVTCNLDSPSLGLAQWAANALLREGIESRLTVPYTLPKGPAVAPIALTLTFPQGKMTERRWLCTVNRKAVVAELAKLTETHVGIQFRGKAEEPLRVDSGASFRAATNTVGGVEKSGFFCHPPYMGGVGYAFGEFAVTLPNEPCEFETLVGFTDGSSSADGCVFSLDVKVDKAWETVWKAAYADLKRWKAFRADLAKFRGKTVALRLTTDVGPADDSSSDWAAWGEPRIVLAGDRLLPEVLDKEPIPPTSPPPIPLKGLKESDLRDIAEAKIILDGAGVNVGEYESDVYLNEVLIGHTPASASDTAWSEKQAIPVPPEALKTVGRRNTVVIRNPRQDCMKVRRIHLWFRLRDGRVGTSCVATGPFCSDAGWAHTEGEGVPLGADLPAMECEIPVGQ